MEPEQLTTTEDYDGMTSPTKNKTVNILPSLFQ
jgi:hypothetical protein